MSDYQFNSLDECDTQDKAEEYYRERGWDILRPRVNKCEKHEFVKVGDREYQCKCGKGYIGDEPPKV